MLTFLTWLGSFLSGPIISALAKGWADHESAVNTGAQIEATKAVQLAQVQAQIDAASKQLLIAEQGHWYTAIVRPLFAAPFVIYLWKVIVWDRVVFHTFTYDLTDAQTQLMMVVVVSYFGHSAYTTGARINARKG